MDWVLKASTRAEKAPSSPAQPAGVVGDGLDVQKGAKGSLDWSPKENWVDRAGGLPAYIEEIALALIRDHGFPRERAIPIAINRVKRWAAGGDNVHPDTRAKAAKAVAEWEAKRVKTAAQHAAKHLKKSQPRDGDGDGRIYDGTPREQVMFGLVTSPPTRPVLAPAYPSTAGRFHEAFEAAMDGNEKTAFVSHYSVDELRGMKTYLHPTGKAGIVVKDHHDGRIEGSALFNASGIKGLGRAILKAAIDRDGINYLECYGEDLRVLYESLGFEVTDKAPFNEDWAAPNWDYEKHNHPNYYILDLKVRKTEDWIGENAAIVDRLIAERKAEIAKIPDEKRRQQELNILEATLGTM